MMKRLLILLLPLLCLFGTEVRAQYAVTAHQVGWNNIPPAAQRPGFSFQRSVLAQMDDDPALEEVMLFGHDNGHWPEFDLFKAYYAIVDTYTHEVEYISEGEYVTDEYNLTVEDRNGDGRAELYFFYIEPGTFHTDEDGWHKRFVHTYDRIEFVKP